MSILTNRRATLLQGDCLEYLPQLQEASVHLVLCDLPYGVTDCQWDRPIDLAALWKEYRRVLAPGGAIALFAQGHIAREIQTTFPPTWFRYELVWDKQGASGWLNARRLPMRAHELLLIYGRRIRYTPVGLHSCRRIRTKASTSDVYRGARRDGEQKETGFATSLLRFPREKGAKACQKPVALLDWAVQSYSRAGELILDNAMGLGSTGVAAVGAGRRFVGMEIDPERFRVAEERIQHAGVGRVV